MNTAPDSTALARRALTHLRNKTTDQAPSTMDQPVEAYADPQRYRVEVERIFKHLPLALALSVELPAPKTYRAMTVMEMPIILVRGEDGVARAFINACRHRGAQLCKAGSGTLQRFVCPYHAWQYDLQGRLTGLFGEATFGEVSARTQSLTELPCAERAETPPAVERQRAWARRRSATRCSYDVSTPSPSRSARSASWRAVKRSTIRMGPPQRGQGHVTRVGVGSATTGGSGVTASARRHCASAAVRQRAASRPTYRMRTKRFGRTCSRNRWRKSSIDTVAIFTALPWR